MENEIFRPIYVPADQGLVSEISQEDKEDVLASLLPGSSPSTPRSSIFVTNKVKLLDILMKFFLLCI